MDIARLSTCSIALHDRPLAEALAIIAAAGFKKVDLLGRMPHFSLDPAECDPVALKAAAAAAGLQIANLGTYVGAGFASEERTAQAKEWADMQRALDVAAWNASCPGFSAAPNMLRPGASTWASRTMAAASPASPNCAPSWRTKSAPPTSACSTNHAT